MGLIILSQQKARQWQKDKYHMISLRCGIKNRTEINIHMKENRLRDQTCGSQGGGEGKIGSLEFGISNHLYIYIRWINLYIYRWGNSGNSGRVFFWAPKSLQMVTAAMKLKDAWKESYDQPRQHIKKQRCYFANKGPSSQGLWFFQ